MDNNLVKYFENVFSSKKVGHAFLIANTNLDSIRLELVEILSKYFFYGEVNIEDNPNIYIIDNNNNIITKSEVLDIQEKLNTKSSFSKNKIYIINNCEFLNVAAANSMLKLLEEPEDNIYAFLITENISKVLLTIKSRCQILYVKKDKKIIDKVEDEILNFINLIETKKNNGIAYLNEIFPKFPDKDRLREIFEIVEYLYSDSLKVKLDMDPSNTIWQLEKLKEIAENNSTEDLVKKSLIFYENRKNIDYNLNISLIFDKIFIELM